MSAAVSERGSHSFATNASGRDVRMPTAQGGPETQEPSTTPAAARGPLEIALAARDCDGAHSLQPAEDLR